MALPAVGGSSGPAGYQDQNLVKVADYLHAHGYSKAAAAGIAGTIAGESGGNPESAGSGGRGLIGWTPPSTLPNSAFTGNAQHDLIAQAAEIIVFNQKNDPGSIHQLNSFTDPVKAADFYSRVFERPARPLSDVRPDVATWVFGQITGIGGGLSGTASSGPISQDLFGGIAGDLLNPALSSLGVSSLTDLFERGFLIVVGIILIIFGVIKLGSSTSRQSSGHSDVRDSDADSSDDTEDDYVDDPRLEAAYDRAEASGELLPDEAHDTNPSKHTAPGHVKGRRSVAGATSAGESQTIEEFGKRGPKLAA